MTFTAGTPFKRQLTRPSRVDLNINHKMAFEHTPVVTAERLAIVSSRIIQIIGQAGS